MSRDDKRWLRLNVPEPVKIELPEPDYRQPWARGMSRALMVMAAMSLSVRPIYTGLRPEGKR